VKKKIISGALNTVTRSLLGTNRRCETLCYIWWIILRSVKGVFDWYGGA